MLFPRISTKVDAFSRNFPQCAAVRTTSGRTRPCRDRHRLLAAAVAGVSRVHRDRRNRRGIAAWEHPLRQILISVIRNKLTHQLGKF